VKSLANFRPIEMSDPDNPVDWNELVKAVRKQLFPRDDLEGNASATDADPPPDIFGSPPKIREISPKDPFADAPARGSKSYPITPAPPSSTQSDRPEDDGVASSERQLGNVEAPAVATSEPVLLCTSAPQTVKAGDEFTARLVAYIQALENTVREELQQLSPRATSHMGLKTCQWRRGTKVKVRLTGRSLIIQPAEQEFVWDESKNLVEFDVLVPNDAQEGTTVLKFDVSIEEFVVAMLRLDLQITAHEVNTNANSGPMTSTAISAARTAFASYSSQDRERVLDRVAAVRISAGLDIFLDCMSLNPGESWKPKLECEIKARDLFLLFWSASASESKWVRWEWQTALRDKGKSAMQIHPLQAGVRPPEELKDLHFGDVYMLIREGNRMAEPASSTNV
jgi:hypothetical protein